MGDLINGFSHENSSDSNDKIFAKNNDVIGASLLPFLPSGRIDSDERKCEDGNDSTRHAVTMELDAGGLHSKVPERNITPECTHDNIASNDGRKRRDCTSLLLDGSSNTSRDSSIGGNCLQQLQERKTRMSRKRILLRGPAQSGKTSLAMNLAYAEASAEINCCGGLPCKCVASIVYRPMRSRNSINNRHSNNNRNDDDDDDDECSNGDNQFPLFCRALPAQREDFSRSNTHVQEGNDQHNEGFGVNSHATVEMAASAEKKEAEEDSWNQNTLNRIQICHVSSLRDLWQNILGLAGKPLHERPSRAVVVEDLDEIIGFGEDFSHHNRTSGDRRSNTSYNSAVSMMLKTVAIVADTVLAIENSQTGRVSSQSRRNYITMLFTLSIDSQQQRRDNSKNLLNQHQRSSVMSSAQHLTNVLASASCIDTVVTLRQREMGEHSALRGNNTNLHDKTTANCDKNLSGDHITIKKDQKNNPTDERVAVNSFWQAEIQERAEDGAIGDVLNGNVSIVDYEIVESLLDEDTKNSLGDCTANKELRWKHR